MAAADLLHPSDLALLPVEVDDDGLTGRFELIPGLIRHDGALYGGTGLAVSVMAMQAATQRDVFWSTTQFVFSPPRGSVIEWRADLLAHGHRTSQVQVTATCEGQVAFVALGAAGVAREEGLTGGYRTMPEVASAPEDSTPWDSPGGARFPDSWGLKIDLREAVLADPTSASTALWVRRRDSLPFTPVAVAFSADFIPLGVARAAGKIGAGSSLDNTLRFRPGQAGEWALLELHGDFASGGYGHGAVYVWSQDGELLAAGSQSANMKYLWDEGETPKIQVPPSD